MRQLDFVPDLRRQQVQWLHRLDARDILSQRQDLFQRRLRDRFLHSDHLHCPGRQLRFGFRRLQRYIELRHLLNRLHLHCQQMRGCRNRNNRALAEIRQQFVFQ